MKKVALHNLGCKVNSYETDSIAQTFSENGYEVIPFGVGADVYIINTCSVTNIADRKSRQMLHKAKKMNPDAVVVATGCYVQTAGEDIAKDEAIDIVVGNNNKSKIFEIVNEYLENKEKSIVIDDISKNTPYEDMVMTTITEHTRAFVKIQDGCNQFCTYCIIPYARGRIRSRNLKLMVEEITELAKNGFKEIVLTGIHLSSYGKDITDENITLIDAIYAVAKIDGVERVRLGSLEPMIITEEFMDRLIKIDEFCPHFHLSLQSGCDETLKRMNRHYTSDMYYEKCELIRKYYVDAAITTDVIVGFPGETEDEFEITRKFLDKVHFSEMHIFKYSKRKGTVAEKMDNQVDEQIKSLRSDVLIDLNDNMHKEYLNRFIGQKKEVLFEEIVKIDDGNYLIGYTKEYLKVAICPDETLIGNVKEVEISGINGEFLLAR